MVSKHEVEIFLRELKVKSEVFGILFLDDRGKNQQTLHDLEITPSKRKEIIANIRVGGLLRGSIERKDAWHFAYVGIWQRSKEKGNLY